MVVFLSWSIGAHTQAHSATQFSKHKMRVTLQQPHISRCFTHSNRSQRWCPCNHRSGVIWVSGKPTTHAYTKLYSFRFDCKIVSFTAANTNRIFSVSRYRKTNSQLATHINLKETNSQAFKSIHNNRYRKKYVSNKSTLCQNFTGSIHISRRFITFRQISNDIIRSRFNVNMVSLTDKIRV